MISIDRASISEAFFLFIIFTIAIFLRYFLTSAFADWLVIKLKVKKVFELGRDKFQGRREILYSFYSALIFGAAFLGMSQFYQLQEFYAPWWFHLSGIVGAMLIHETYYYFLHRWMHIPKVYRKIHKTHHDSVETSAWTAFSFHPLETILQVVPFALIIYMIPLHMYSLAFLLSYMTISATINHLNVEVYPKWFLKNWLTRNLVGATHHALHHKEFKTNYGLYFTFWDRWLGTESDNYLDK